MWTLLINIFISHVYMIVWNTMRFYFTPMHMAYFYIQDHFYFLQRHLQSGVQYEFVFPHLQWEQSLLQLQLINCWQADNSSGMPTPWEDEVEVVELVLWSRLSNALTVKSPFRRQAGGTTPFSLKRSHTDVANQSSNVIILSDEIVMPILYSIRISFLLRAIAWIFSPR